MSRGQSSRRVEGSAARKAGPNVSGRIGPIGAERPELLRPGLRPARIRPNPGWTRIGPGPDRVGRERRTSSGSTNGTDFPFRRAVVAAVRSFLCGSGKSRTEMPLRKAVRTGCLASRGSFVQSQQDPRRSRGDVPGESPERSLARWRPRTERGTAAPAGATIWWPSSGMSSGSAAWDSV